MGQKDIKNFTKYPSLSDDDILLGSKTSLGGTDAGITVANFKKQVVQDVKPTIVNGYWWVDNINTGVLATGRTPKFRKTSAGLEMKYEDQDDTAYILLIPMSDLAFTFDDLSPEQVEKLKLKFSDLTDAEKEALRGAAFTYDMFTNAQLADLRLTYDKLTPAEKADIKGERGYSAFEVWAQQEDNAGKTVDDYLAYLRQPATDAAAEVRQEMVQLSAEVNQMVTDVRQLEATIEEQEGVREDSYMQWQAKEQARQNAEIKRKEEFAQIKTDAGTATESALAAAKKANDTNLAVEAAEQKRKDDETKRIEQSEADKIAEQARKDAELIRQKQEEKREKDTAQAILDTNTAKQGSIEATTNAKSVSDHPGYIGSDYHVYTWDYVTGAYKKTDTILRPEGFSVYRTYASIAAMNADIANVPEGKFILINTNDVENPDNAKLYVRGATSFEYLVDMSGAIGFTGKTPGFTVGTVTEGDAMNVTLSENGTDPDGNPLYKLNFVLRRGPQGFTPIIQTGTITTGLPGTNVSVELIPNGQTEEGREKYLLNLVIPRGNPGTGNVSVLGTGLIAGKTYLFVPGADNSTEGAFVEYVIPDNFPEAPKDGKTYGRKDGEWSEVNSAGNMDGGTAFSVYGGALVMDGGNAND